MYEAYAQLLLLRQSADTHQEENILFKSFYVLLCSLLCQLSGSSLAGRETPPDLLIDWLARAHLSFRVRSIGSEWSVMSRRDDTSTSSLFSCIFLIAFVSQASHHQYIEFPMDWTEFFPLQDCTLSHYVHTYNTKDTLPWRGGLGGYQIILPSLFISPTCIFFLFELQASLSAERALSAFHYLLHRLF